MTDHLGRLVVRRGRVLRKVAGKYSYRPRFFTEIRGMNEDYLSGRSRVPDTWFALHRWPHREASLQLRRDKMLLIRKRECEGMKFQPSLAQTSKVFNPADPTHCLHKLQKYSDCKWWNTHLRLPRTVSTAALCVNSLASLTRVKCLVLRPWGHDHSWAWHYKIFLTTTTRF